MNKRKSNYKSTYKKASGLALFKKSQAYRAKVVAASRGSLPRRAQQMMSMTNRSPEIHAIDVTPISQGFRTIATPPTLVLLNGIQTGAGFFNRVGSRVENVNLHIRGVVNIGLTTLISYARMVVVYDRQPNGAAPLVGDILQSRDQTGAPTGTAFSEINLDQRQRYLILRDKSFFVPPTTFTAGVLTNGPAFPSDGPEWTVNEFIRLKGLITQYKSSSAPTTITDINSGSIYVFFLASVDNTLLFNGQCRLRFVDI